MADPVFVNYNAKLNESMVKAYNKAMQIQPEQNIRHYFNEIYESYDREMALPSIEGDYRNEENTSPNESKNFLEDVECVLSKELFKRIVEATGLFDDLGMVTINRPADIPYTVQEDQIHGNDILFIKCPTVFATYHYITVVVSQDRTQVDVYQSFGSSTLLHKLTLPFNQFIGYLNDILNYKNPDNFFEKYPTIRSVEENLYGINIKDYMKLLKDNEAEEVEDFRTRKEKADDRKLGLSPYDGITLRSGYDAYINPEDLSINIYRLKPEHHGGKKKRKTKKNIKNKKVTKKRNKRIKKTRKN